MLADREGENQLITNDDMSKNDFSIGKKSAERALLGSGKDHFSFYKGNRYSVVRQWNLKILLSNPETSALAIRPPE